MTYQFRQISKGPVCAYLDELSRDADAAKKLEGLAAGLKKIGGDYKGLTGVFSRHLFRGVDADKRKSITDYLSQQWFNPTKGWWGHLQPIAPVFGAGVLKAVEESLANATGKAGKKVPLPIDSYWMAVDDRMEAAVMRSRHQVTLLILTPRPPSIAKMGGIGCAKTAVWSIREQPTPVTRRKVKPEKLDSSSRYKRAK